MNSLMWESYEELFCVLLCYAIHCFKRSMRIGGFGWVLISVGPSLWGGTVSLKVRHINQALSGVSHKPWCSEWSLYSACNDWKLLLRNVLMMGMIMTTLFYVIIMKTIEMMILAVVVGMTIRVKVRMMIMLMTEKHSVCDTNTSIQ